MSQTSIQEFTYDGRTPMNRWISGIIESATAMVDAPVYGNFITILSTTVLMPYLGDPNKAAIVIEFEQIGDKRC